MDITCIGSNISVRFDGADAYSFVDDTYTEGALGLDMATPGIEIETLEYLPLKNLSQ